MSRQPDLPPPGRVALVMVVTFVVVGAILLLADWLGIVSIR